MATSTIEDLRSSAYGGSEPGPDSAGVTTRRPPPARGGKRKARLKPINRADKNAKLMTEQLVEAVSELQGTKDALREAVNEEPNIQDLMHPYVVGPSGEDLTANWTLSQYTKENLISDTVLKTQLSDLADILICDIDFRRVAHLSAGIHAARLVEVAALFAGISLGHALTHGEFVPFCPEVMKTECHERLDQGVVSLTSYSHASFLQLRASIEPYYQSALEKSDTRPSFDRSEKRLIEDLFLLEPYILLRVDPKDGRNPQIIDDPLAFAMFGWEDEASAWQKLMCLKVPFRQKIISSQLLAELVNRRTVLSGLDDPKTCWNRMTDIIERSPCFQEHLSLRLTTGVSVASDTRDVAFAMVTSQPWLVRNQAF